MINDLSNEVEYSVEYSGSRKIEYYKLNGRFHNPNGPAILNSNGAFAYYLNGRFHRLDGPAIMHPDNSLEYWENGVKIK